MLTESFVQKIPNGFARKYGGDMSNPMSIKPPDGTEWKLYWNEHGSDIWFQKGWKEFSKYYSLDHGHLVLFEYKDASHFGVHIFDKSTLEIEYPSHENQDEEHNPDQIDDDSVEILDKIPPCKKTKRKSPISCPQPRKKLRTSTSEDVGRRPKLQKFPKQHLVGGNQSQGTNFEESTLEMEPVHNELEDDAGGTTECLKGEHLTSKTTKPLKRAGALRFGNSFFTITMKPYNIDGCALVKIQHIPSQFAKKHLKKKREILLQVLDGRTWSVTYNLCKFCAGWKKFALDNKLKVGDVCHFELNKRGGHSLKFKVSIFPVAEEQHSPRSQEDADGTTECLKGAHLTSKTTEALNRAGTPGSENAFFTVMMKPYSVYDRCLVKIQRIPSHFANKYLKKKRDIVLQVLDGRPWSVCYNLYKFSGGWKEFALDNKLKVGDVCRFELNQSGGLSLKLKVLIFPAAEEPHSPRSQGS
ncbi:B3 domain-containing transcription factor VRN1-like [Lotus japonicus]|uniref:B3 domain-containing transcription factor VRN1-like n=1 Tax=Lotus japonicus TaxID=34305 RepID=UPI002584E1AB|nr:B3 domain-containing transcription factor VRN1-like [Lotus japonicus]